MKRKEFRMKLESLTEQATERGLTVREVHRELVDFTNEIVAGHISRIRDKQEFMEV